MLLKHLNEALQHGPVREYVVRQDRAPAGLNALAFDRGVFRSAAAWDREVPAPAPAKAAAILSLLLWAGVISCGRLLAYL